MKSFPSGGRNRRYRHQYAIAMRQKETAAKLSIGQTDFVHLNWEPKKLKSEDLNKICNCFGIDMQDLLSVDQQDDSPMREQCVRKIADALSGLSIDRLSVVRAVVLSMLAD